MGGGLLPPAEHCFCRAPIRLVSSHKVLALMVYEHSPFDVHLIFHIKGYILFYGKILPVRVIKNVKQKPE